MRKKLTTAFLALVCAASVVIACQPALDDGRPTRRRLAEAVPASGTEAAPTTAAAGVGPTILLTTPSTTLAPATPTTIGVARPSPLPPASPGGDIEEEWYGSGPRVAILGDSLTVQARPAIRALAAGSYALKIGALYGEGMSGGALSAHRPEPLMPEVVARYAEEPPDVVVLALGTNDVWLEGLGPASFERAWQEATRAFDGACTVGVTVTETDDAPGYDPEEARRVNRVIRRTVDVVVDWQAEGPSDRLTGHDHIHLNETGRQRFAELVIGGIERCTTSP